MDQKDLLIAVALLAFTARGPEVSVLSLERSFGQRAKQIGEVDPAQAECDHARKSPQDRAA